MMQKAGATAISGILLLALVSCQGQIGSLTFDDTASGQRQQEIPASCGDGKIDPGEVCDGGAIPCPALDGDRYLDGGAACNLDCLSYYTELCVEKATVDQEALASLIQEEERRFDKEAPVDAAACIHPVPDYSQPGPYQVASGSGPMGFAIYYPKELGQSGCRHPIITWGNGTAVVGALVYEPFFKLWASHGFVVIAAATPMAGSGLEIRQGLDWYLAQNRAAGSPFFGKLAEKGASAGHSQGGIGASAASSHPNIVSVMNIEGAAFLSSKPTFFLTGTLDLMCLLASMSYAFASGPSILGIVNGADHIASPTILGMGLRSAPSVEFLRVSTSWFLCYLMGDQTACGFFKGPNAKIRNNPAWSKVDQKNL